jgi:hypothetical protein
MPHYLRTSRRRYLWGIGVACSLLFLAVTASFALGGSVVLRLGGTEFKISQGEARGLFWATIAVAGAVGATGLIATGIGLRRAQLEESAHS